MNISGCWGYAPRTLVLRPAYIGDQIMARRAQRTNPPEDVTDHRFLQFPQTLSDATRARYSTNLSLLLTKEIDIAPSFDWELATRTGLVALIQEFLQYTHSDASGVELFVCQGWARLFRIQEPVYREFLMEFYATVSYDPRKALDDRTAFAFRLGGVSRECSVIELATRVGIYTADETRSVHFPTFLADCLTDRPEDYNENTFWAEITGGVYTPSTARGGMIRSTTYRMLHRLISMSLMHHKNSERVPSTDLSPPGLTCIVIITRVSSHQVLHMPNIASDPNRPPCPRHEQILLHTHDYPNDGLSYLVNAIGLSV
ncbi:unnamed protein product [Lactuca saligna]|uniref:Uncharacterized protein n=1 Tax=Lactuca saligna TaxID=75948 RepID=A0AA35ZPE6_LACSI|nr:unnamed protein product [Lactuca saligna]